MMVSLRLPLSYKYLHSTVPLLIPLSVCMSTDQTGWYQRMDNNGWRLVSDRLIHHIMADPVTWETSSKKYAFHHDKVDHDAGRT